MIARFFIDRPVFSVVVSLLITIAGSVAIAVLPVARYPEIVPPTININATYPGADAETAAQSVAAPIEQELSGIRNLIYFSSQSANNGTVRITATFEIGTDQDLAAVEIQNRLAVAEPRLPQEVVRNGITVTKASTNILGVVTLEADEDSGYDEIYLANYATIQLLDRVRRVPGVGDATVFGTKEYAMRIWVDPDRLTGHGMTVSDVAAAIREQNALFPAGTIGQRPTPEGGLSLTVPLLTQGRLAEASQYEDIILRADESGSIVRLQDVARVELGSRSYDLFSRVNGRETTLIIVYLQTGANALDTIRGVREAMDAAAPSFPEGVRYRIPFDTTEFIDQSIDEVVATLLEAVLLVLLVVFVFLQSARATLIPLLAVPVAIIGTFAGMLVLGFSINTLTLFGLVLAIGIVVDDAIIVVENVERIMRDEGRSPRDATIAAMQQVTGPVIAIVLVLSAVFVPVAFLGGLTGQLYKQFAVTIAISVAISGVVALTLSPALCSLLLRPRHSQRKAAPFRWFDRAFGAVTRAYARGAELAIRHAVVAVLTFAALCFATWRLQARVPGGFLPEEDQGYVLSAVLLPDGASLDRTDAVARRVERFFLDHPAVRNVTLLGGIDLLSGGFNASNAATLFIALKSFDQRQGSGLSAQALVADAFAHFAADPDAMVMTFNPPSIQGLGRRSGFELELQQRGGGTSADLAATAAAFTAAAEADPALEAVRGTMRFALPQLFVELDREKTRMTGTRIADVFESLQTYFGALYVNDFTRFGRIWRVQLQAEARFRDAPEDIGRIWVRNEQGEMLPLSGLVRTRWRVGPNVVSRFNGFPSVQVTGAPSGRRSTGEAMAAVRAVAAQALPPGYGIEWSGVSYQEIKVGNQAPLVLAFGLLVVYLVLAAQYERWSMPIAVLLTVPLAVLGALFAIWLRGQAQDIYFQIGLLTLVGLAAKNAILIVEFCVALRRQGAGIVEAAIEAARLRLRPIVMTSLAFVLGVLPLALATGAGAAARHSIGTGVIGGMLAATFVAVFFVPLFFVLIQRASERLVRRRAAAPAASAAPAVGTAAAD
jgi:hydrophobe/amphiphile efflux-1 (HAE1) family protein